MEWWTLIGGGEMWMEWMEWMEWRARRKCNGREEEAARGREG